jgi:paraquat-inducible protein A
VDTEFTATAHRHRPLIGCPECDLLFHLPELRPGDTALCPRCERPIAAMVRDGFLRPLLYALTGLIFLVVALSFPFLTLHTSGMENAMTLLQVVTSMVFFGQDTVGFLVMCFVFVFPALVLSAVCLVCLALLARRPYAWVRLLSRLLFSVNDWAMVEVFAIGVIVSLVKVVHLASVDLGTSFWGFLGFALSFLLTVNNLDRYSVWSTIERLGAGA